MPIKLGAAWYPEHWPEQRWEVDLHLMRDAHLNIVRVGEYAWSCLEPEEGRFTFDWLDRAIDLAIGKGQEVVLGTPTSSPPAWVIQKYPETQQTNAEGKKVAHGNRGHTSPTSATWLRLGRQIVEQMATRYGQNPAIIGWQIDNELWAMSYDDDCQRQFQAWLRDQYGTLDALNQHWSTAYWSQTYFDWSQIPLPVGAHNPGLMLAFKRFTTFVYRAYLRNQIEVIRQYAGAHQKITHNCLGFVAPMDYYALNEELDFAAWDHYVGTGDPNIALHSFESSLIRGFKRQNYWVMETQPGWVNWAKVNSAHVRGEVRAMAWHDIGHGADAVLYWQWRSALNGQEEYHGCLIAPDGNPRPIYREIAELGQELATLNTLLDGSSPVAEAAILHDYDSRWALHWQPHHHEFDAMQYALGFYAPLRRLLHTVDVVHPRAPLDGYKLVIAPMLHILDAEKADHLRRFVERGGHLVLGVRAGMKDSHNALLPSRQPGMLAADAGAHVEEFFALLDPIPVSGEHLSGSAKIWAEWLTADANAEILMRYGIANGWLDGQAALVTRQVGKGRITCFGAWFDEALMREITGWLIETSAITPTFPPVPDGIEVCRRVSDHGEIFILINHTSTAHEIFLPFSTSDLRTGEIVHHKIDLPARGVRLMQRESAQSSSR